MSEIISNRTELLFLYDIENANPNGDPLNENRPRFDSDTSTVLVSDVRLKRSIRDYWYEYKDHNGINNKDIFIRRIYDEEKNLGTCEKRAKDFENPNHVLEVCIDVRVFGSVITIKSKNKKQKETKEEKESDNEKSITFTGPTQFQMGRSINKTNLITEQGIGAFASSEGKENKTFRTEYKIPYAIIGFNGIINEKAAQYSRMTEEDKSLLLEGIWEGTKNLISRSKFGQTPLLLLTIDYNEPFYIGNLRQKVKLICTEGEEKIRSVNDYKLDITEIAEELKKVKDKIKTITLKTDSKLSLISNGKTLSLTKETVKIDELE